MTHANFILLDFLTQEETSHFTLISHSISYYTSMYAVRWCFFNHSGIKYVLMWNTYMKGTKYRCGKIAAKIDECRIFYMKTFNIVIINNIATTDMFRLLMWPSSVLKLAVFSLLLPWKRVIMWPKQVGGYYITNLYLYIVMNLLFFLKMLHTFQ